MKQNHHEAEVPLTEDFMREHGVLNRALLIYEEIIRRVQHQEEYPVSALQKTIDIIRFFIEGHHERMEEDYIFPLFEKHGQQLELIATLKEQHRKGREITSHLETIITNTPIDRAGNVAIKHLLEQFIAMYRPHEAHEDTDIFPRVRSFMTEEEFEALGETIETFEHQLFGEHGLEDMIKKLATIEQQLQIDDLNQYTPQV